MRKAIGIILVAILIYLAFSLGRTCSTLRRSKFQSPEEKTGTARLPMSDTEPGLYYTYHTTIYFRDGQFDQQESDYFFTGPYMCVFGTIVAHPSSGGTIFGAYNPLSGTLLWNGEWYQQNYPTQIAPSADLTKTPSSIRIEVASTKAWQVTGVTVHEGERVTITYISGLWTFDRNIPRTDGAGKSDYTSADAPIPSANLGALVAKIDNGSPFLVGNQVSTTSDRSGDVFLRINDSEAIGDNEGRIIVEINKFP